MADVTAGSTDLKGIFSRRHSPFLGALVPDAKFSLAKFKSDLGGFASLQKDLFKTTKVLERLAGRLGKSNVGLGNFCTVNVASVLDSDGSRNQLVTLALLDLELAVGEIGVGKTIAEGEERFNVLGIKVSVSNVETLSVVNLFIIDMYEILYLRSSRDGLR